LEQGFLKFSFEDIDIARNVFGPGDENIRHLKKYFNIKTSIKGTDLIILGEKKELEETGRIIREMEMRVRKGSYVGPEYIDQTVRQLPGKEVAEEDYIYILPTKKRVVPRSRNQKRYIEAMRRNDIVVGIGPAGTGKTYLACAMALSSYYRREVGRIILTRPAIEAGERLGFLPGTMYEKVNPYLRPLYDALYDMLDTEKVLRLIERGVIEIAPLAFMRGRTLNDAFVILDEAQNAHSDQMKMFLTRLGFSSRAVITGDITQIDLPDKKSSGLLEIRKILKGIKGIKFVYFTEKDVVRHPLVQKIIRAYERSSKEKVDAGTKRTTVET